MQLAQLISSTVMANSTHISIDYKHFTDAVIQWSVDGLIEPRSDDNVNILYTTEGAYNLAIFFLV